MRALVRRIEVLGDSMVPALHPGDRLLVLPARRYRVGDIVALPDPRVPARLIVKRVAAAAADDEIVVTGDNESASTDSRAFGPVMRQQLVGRAVYRYAPAGRTGRLGRSHPIR